MHLSPPHKHFRPFSKFIICKSTLLLYHICYRFTITTSLIRGELLFFRLRPRLSSAMTIFSSPSMSPRPRRSHRNTAIHHLGRSPRYWLKRSPIAPPEGFGQSGRQPSPSLCVKSLPHWRQPEPQALPVLPRCWCSATTRPRLLWSSMIHFRREPDRGRLFRHSR